MSNGRLACRITPAAISWSYRSSTAGTIRATTLPLSVTSTVSPARTSAMTFAVRWDSSRIPTVGCPPSRSARITLYMLLHVQRLGGLDPHVWLLQHLHHGGPAASGRRDRQHPVTSSAEMSPARPYRWPAFQGGGPTFHGVLGGVGHQPHRLAEPDRVHTGHVRGAPGHFFGGPGGQRGGGEQSAGQLPGGGQQR